MKLPAIKKLLKVDIEELRKAEELLAEEKEPQLEIEGDDQGDKLTHVFGAIWVKEQIAAGTMDEKEALRAFTKKVRGSIS
jgi:hypothetical protein